MIIVKVSSNNQVVIPKKIRKEFDIKVGQRIQLIHYQNRIEFIPLRDIRKWRRGNGGIKS
jgi:AbrB family looped-hinge helix DNA binding protein